jgi:hypothetical protein
MKKSVVAVGVIVALGVVWTGASWFTGKQLEGVWLRWWRRPMAKSNVARQKLAWN